MSKNTEYKGNDFYCDVALKDILALDKEYESDNVLAFHHTRPYFPIHIVVIPKKHIPSFSNIEIAYTEILLEMIRVTQEIANMVEIKTGGARVQTNLGKYQDSKHLHFFISSGEPLK